MLNRRHFTNRNESLKKGSRSSTSVRFKVQSLKENLHETCRKTGEGGFPRPRQPESKVKANKHIIDSTTNIKTHCLYGMMLYEVSKSPDLFRFEFLEQHQVTPYVRARMVN